jgi:hypothetical protein
MAKNDQTERHKKPATNEPVPQQFASGGSAVPAPQMPYDIEEVQGQRVKPAPKPTKD